MAGRIFGDIPGYPPGSLFEDRLELREAGVHRPPQAGISGNQAEGADSIVLSGGYEDDEDHGDVIIYTGQGGRDALTGIQTHDQPFVRGNRALAFSSQNNLPVRVIRGSGHDSPYSPKAGYSYDGLFHVEDFWHEIGRSGFRVWRFKLVKAAIYSPGESGSYSVSEEPAEYRATTRIKIHISRIVRNTSNTNKIKTLYDYRCQVCDTRLDCPAGPYAEAAHIKPLGIPHDGPDDLSNMLCLCPNHHVLFDTGAISIAEDFSLIGEPGTLTVQRRHKIGQDYLAYHREHYLTDLEET